MNVELRAEQAEADTFVIHLTREAESAAQVTSIELFNADMRNRYSFKTSRQLDEVFAAPLSVSIRQALARLKSDERVVALPEFEVSFPGLVLSGLRILRNCTENGLETIMLRFRTYVGAIKTAFRFDSSFGVNSASVRERIAVEVLRDILTPLIDMINLNQPEYASVVENHSSVLQSRLDHIGRRQEELNFYSGLLQRYVAGCRQDAEHEQFERAPEARTLRSSG